MDYFSIHAIPTFLVEAVVFSPLIILATLLLVGREGESPLPELPQHPASARREHRSGTGQAGRTARLRKLEKEPICSRGA
jgi:hypothetical protein